MFSILEDAADWADLRYVDYCFVRDGAQWEMKLRFSDALGEYSWFVPLYEGMKNLRGVLDRACIDARKHRKNRVVSGKVRRRHA